MYLTQIAEELVLGIKDSRPEDWGGGLDGAIILPHDDFPVSSRLDPDNFHDETGSPKSAIVIVPGIVEYDLGKKRGSNPKLSVSRIKYVSLTLHVKFVSSVSGDAAADTEWKPISNLREDLENYIIQSPISANLVSVEPEPPDEQAFDNRLYMSSTVFGFRSC